MKNKTLAILVGDIHLSHKCPVARSTEPDWYAAMQRPLDQLCELSGEHHAPLICAGDIFHRWNECPELINWAIEHLPLMHAIPGQHDLPLHNYADMHKSAYWTLVKAGVVRHLPRGRLRLSDRLEVVGCAWGREILPAKPEVDVEVVRLLVAHQYVWIQGKGYMGAPTMSRVSNLRESLAGYNAALFGDNHQEFVCRVGDCHVINPGVLIRRASDEREYHPCVGLLQSDGSIIKHTLDCSADKWCKIDDSAPGGTSIIGQEIKTFLRSLGVETSESVDYLGLVRRAATDNQVGERARRLLLELVEGG